MPIVQTLAYFKLKIKDYVVFGCFVSLATVDTCCSNNWLLLNSFDKLYLMERIIDVCSKKPSYDGKPLLTSGYGGCNILYLL